MVRVLKRFFKFLFAHSRLSLAGLFFVLALGFCFLYLLVFTKTTVPNLVGKDIKEARRLIAARALRLEVSEQKFSSRYAKGQVVAQVPEAGERVSKQSRVKVIVSKGPRLSSVTEVLVPNVVNLLQDRARLKLESVGLKVRIKEEHSLNVPEGLVISQYPEARVKVKRGTVVILLVSSGPLIQAEDTGGKIVCIDAGHQAQADLRPEPIGPGSTTTKERVRGGASGVYSHVPEYKITLDISLKLKSLLEQAGFQVVMVRETHNVNISASERAQIANRAQADLFLRIHCDSSSNHSVKGISTLYPALNQWTSPIYDQSKQAAQIIQHNLVRVCKRSDRGIVARGDITGFNWSKVPAVLVEAGFLSNPTEDIILNSADGQQKVAQGIFEGVVEYFGGE